MEKEIVLLTTGRKEKLSASKGSQIEVSSIELGWTGNVWYCAILEENLAKSKLKKLSVRHLDPLLKKDYYPPEIVTTVHRLIRPVPPPDLLPDVDFEEGDVIDVVVNGGWWSGTVVQVLGNRHYLVFITCEPDVIVVDRKDSRSHLIWKDEEWFRCEKQMKELTESDFRGGTTVEVRTEIEGLGEIWAPAIVIEANEDETLLVKYKSLKAGDYEYTKTSFPFSKIRPSPPPNGLRVYDLMQNVDVFVNSGWCSGVIRKVLSGNRYTVVLGCNKESLELHNSYIRPSMEWNNGVWKSEGEVLNSKESPHALEDTSDSTRIRVTIPKASSEKKALGTEKNLRTTRSSLSAKQQNSPPASSNGGDVALTGKVSANKSETAAQLPGKSGSKIANGVINENTPVKSQPEIETTKELQFSIVLGIPATHLTKSTVKTKGKTSPRKKLQSMRNQKGSANDSVEEKAPEETKKRESVNKRKRGQPRKFISTDPKQNTGQFPCRTPDPMLNSVVEKHIDVMETPPQARNSTMVLPFAKISPLWKVIESMEIFKAVPQHPHFSPLVESEEESREGDAIGAMVNFNTLCEKANSLQVDDPVSLINRINEGFLKLEKHGFDITAPRSRVGKLLSIKESQSRALEELKVVEKEITEKDNKRRKCEEDIEELSKKIVELQEVKVMMDKEIAQMQARGAVFDQKLQMIEQEFRATVAAPWKLQKL